MFIVRWLEGDGPWLPLLLLVEGALAAASGLFFAWWLFPGEASLVAVFFAALTAQDAGEKLLDWNRDAIFKRNVDPADANVRLSTLFFSLFLGCTIGFSALALSLPMDLIEGMFAHQISDYAGSTVGSLSFGSTSDIFVHNGYVLLFFFIVALPFRHGGVMLAITWNASVWGATFAWLARRWAESGGPSVFEGYLRVVGSIVPHLAIEAMAYALAGLAGVFLATGTLKHGFGSEVLRSIESSVVRMMVAALGLIALGALWESMVAPILLMMLCG